MRYVDLFNELQLSRDYIHDRKSGADWRYHVDRESRRVYVEVQETKTFLDWLHNLNVIPKKVYNSQGRMIKVPSGAYRQAEAIAGHIMLAMTKPDLLGFDWYFCGWSQGGMSSGIAAFMLSGIIPKVHYIGWGTPKFLSKESVRAFLTSLKSWSNFLYRDDWIADLIPLYSRPDSCDVTPVNPDVPETLDQRHRVYGHCVYEIECF